MAIVEVVGAAAMAALAMALFPPVAAADVPSAAGGSLVIDSSRARLMLERRPGAAGHSLSPASRGCACELAPTGAPLLPLALSAVFVWCRRRLRQH